jgi:hypothetical protein
MPFVPTMGSTMMAATVCGPSYCRISSTWARARAHSSSGVVAWNDER